MHIAFSSSSMCSSSNDNVMAARASYKESEWASLRLREFNNAVLLSDSSLLLVRCLNLSCDGVDNRSELKTPFLDGNLGHPLKIWRGSRVQEHWKEERQHQHHGEPWCHLSVNKSCWLLSTILQTGRWNGLKLVHFFLRSAEARNRLVWNERHIPWYGQKSRRPYII